jgi:hypothetical protein
MEYYELEWEDEDWEDEEEWEDEDFWSPTPAYVRSFDTQRWNTNGKEEGEKRKEEIRIECNSSSN